MGTNREGSEGGQGRMHPEEDVTAGGSGGTEEVHAAFITDDGYAAVTATAVTSLKASRGAGGRCHAWVVAVGVSAGNVERLERLAGGDAGYDVCVIAVLKEAAAGEIRARLLDMGVPEEKILWERPQWISVLR